MHHIMPPFVPSGSRTVPESFVTMTGNGHSRPCDDVLHVQCDWAALRMHAVLIDPPDVLTLQRQSGPAGWFFAGAWRGGGGASGGAGASATGTAGICIC